MLRPTEVHPEFFLFVRTPSPKQQGASFASFGQGPVGAHKSCRGCVRDTTVFLLKVPDISHESLDNSKVRRWSLEVLSTILMFFLFEIGTLES